jgi:signal transduction histidine kinase
LNTTLPSHAYAELLQRWLRDPDPVAREAVLLRVDEMSQILVRKMATQDELIDMHHDAQRLLAQAFQGPGSPASEGDANAHLLQSLAAGDALTPLITLLLPVQLAQTRRIQKAEDALHFNDMMEVTARASSLAHDFNNLLGAIIGMAELSLLDVPDDSPLFRRLHAIAQAAKQGSAAVQDLHGFTRSLSMRRLNVALGPWLKGCQGLLAASLPAHVTLDLRIGDDCRVKADLPRLEQVLINLVKNAGYAMRAHGGRVEVILDQHFDAKAAAWARLRVLDRGEGIPADVLPHIFAPYYTTKPAGEGTGLGLSAAHRIIRQHDGSIEVSSTPGDQTVFSVLLPLA